MPGAQRDALFGQLAIELGLVTEAQLAEALDAQAKAAALAGLEVDLPHVLSKKGWLPPEREEELRSAVAIRTGEARLIGDYEVVAKLGQGGMGAVYEAKHVRTGLHVALKILPPSMADAESVARFEREAAIVKELDHENIVSSVEFGYDAKRKCHFCALELVEGECLDEIIERRAQLPQSEALDIARQIAQALQHAHYNGLVHRDVKPENIMITPQGTAKLLDLGLARASARADTRVTQEGHFVGSPHYSSPEQATGARDIDTRTDIYSLGATLYHMVTGRPPFEGDNPAEVLQAHVHDEYLWPGAINEELTDDVCGLALSVMLILAGLAGIAVVFVVRSGREKERPLASAPATAPFTVDVPPPPAVRLPVDERVDEPMPGAPTAQAPRAPSERKARTGTQGPTPASDAGSPQQHVLDGHRYEIVRRTATWEEASALCEERGGHLVSITSERENAFVKSLAARENRGVWIGLFDADGDGVYVNLIGLKGFSWNDEGRLQMSGFVCEWDD